MSSISHRIFVAVGAFAWVLGTGSGSAAPDYSFFEKTIRPILIERCYECHSEEAGEQKGGLWLDRRLGWQEGGDSGAAVTPGEVESSLLVHTIRYTDPDLQMPPKNRLPAEEVAALEKWIALGAPDPREGMVSNASGDDAEIDFEAARDYWAFRPAAGVSVPRTANEKWAYRPVDQFILGRLEAKDLEPTADAYPRQLIRRLYYDLTGLPPTPAETEAFVNNASREAYAALVDKLLARPAFGEKWGRHWLDVARYSDSNGGDRNYTFFQAWRYRNYVIDAFNSDKSYYRFVREQLAGDLLPWTSDEQRHEQLVGSTFLALGPKMLTERDKEKLRLDVADEQVDTMGRAFLGLTLGCARCHDHKFDPVSQEDYYALAGIMRSTQVVAGTRNGCVNVASWVEQVLPAPEPERSELEAKVERLELVMRLTVETLYKDKAGGKMSLDDLPLAGVLYDESDAELTGEWTESTKSDNRFGAQYIHDNKTAKGKKRALFRASLPENGVYEVRLAYSAHKSRARRVPIRIEALEGDHEVTLDETKVPSVGGLFEPIGRYRFEKGARANVEISTEGTEGFVIVDGVQFIPVRDIEREAADLAFFASELKDMEAHERAVKAREASQGDADQLKVAKGDEEKSEDAEEKAPVPLFRMSNAQLKKELTRMVKELKDENLVMAPRDARDAGDIHLRVRGEVGQLGAKIPRRFPLALDDGAVPKIAEGSSGRLELAKWMTAKENALLDRVIVNRLWHHLFGRGIVSSVDNFGEIGDRPTHPELLDYLAAEFRADGGSLKTMIRELVSSRTYQLDAAGDKDLLAVDPENELFGRHSRRRLTAEEIRDSFLFLAGRLDQSQGEATASGYGDDLDKAIDFASKNLRTVYLPIARNNLAAELELFDAPSPDLVTGKRSVTSVPTQSLYLINSEFVAAQAGEIGTSAAAKAEGSALVAVDEIYQNILHRHPEKEEANRAADLLVELSGGADGESAEALTGACTQLAHILLASAEFLFIE